jgi:RNA polymerase sigma-70 factor (ECF subfamily)
MPTPFSEEPETARLLEIAAGGDSSAAGKLLEHHRDRLMRMVRMRMDPRIRGRIGVSDVLQEAYIEAYERIDDYLKRPEVPFYIWLRFIVTQRLLMVHRRHVRAKERAVVREQPLEAAAGPMASSIAIAVELIGRETSPTRAAERAETRQRLAEALESMEPMDREVLVLRHLEQVSNVEVARMLNLDTAAASKRYVRALRKLRDILGEDASGHSVGKDHERR